ncbi:carboxypeptidase-like regulatory domain-containing protein [Longimicrobium sp.]|uniref:carboxypeptidase-like regulatory domain-containing protein n=1 Tax=Longimicrobium sp. TaxID=2029185 RepID=UPI002E33C8BB|nr:carboxypeptidase-like regulatory domain-containing protein [Longimicrobium sp.]HEX6040623.1 carboxypeptidase-like regulatory domain-containing protein [Longimicrobium sp.]
MRVPAMDVRPVACVALALMLGGCAGMLGSAPAVKCTGSNAPDRWTLQAGGVLQGVVTSTRNLPLPGATVRIRPLRADTSAARATTSVTQGAFAIDGVPAGRYVAQATYPGYGTWLDTIEVAPDVGTVPRIRLCSGFGA